MSADGPTDGPSPSELASRLRRRAEQLRPSPRSPKNPKNPKNPRNTCPPPGRSAASTTPSTPSCCACWAEEEQLETLHPRRNWSPAHRRGGRGSPCCWPSSSPSAFALSDARRTTAPDAGAGAARAPARCSTSPRPSLDDLTAEVTIPPGPDIGLSVADKGVTIVEDRFDPGRREGTFAAIIDNPNPDWLAQGVQVDVQFLDEAGAAGRRRQRVRRARPARPAGGGRARCSSMPPPCPSPTLTVTVDVARWRETEPLDGQLHHPRRRHREGRVQRGQDHVRAPVRLRPSRWPTWASPPCTATSSA